MSNIVGAIIGVAAAALIGAGLYIYAKRKVETPPQMEMQMEESIQAVEIATIPASRGL